jgi:hypothetical protein
MSRAYIQLGKNGDILSILPILQNEYRITGEPQNLVVACDYANMLARCKFVKPVKYNGDFSDLSGAIKFAKERFDRVIVPQVYGREFPIQHKHPSFQYDQWDRAGYLDKWDTLSLDVPRPNYAAAMVKKRIGVSRCILFADHSQSSPFRFKDELAGMLEKEFGSTHKIIRLSEVRLVNPMDLLALYDAAELLVSIETFHLHLSAAAHVPVIALATDTPSRWHGTAHHKRFAFYCRYGEWQLRKHELLQHARDAIEKREPVKVRVLPTAHKNGYNCASIQWQNRAIRTYRFHPNGTPKTLLAIQDGEATQQLKVPESLPAHSLEDGRLFTHKGKLWLSYVVSMWPKTPHCVMGYGELFQDGGEWKLLKHIQPKYGRNDFGGMEKNWVFFDYDGKLYCIYGVANGQQTILHLEGDRVISEHKAPTPTWGYGEIRGGVIVPHNGKLLRFFHSRTEPTPRMSDWRYNIGVATMAAEPPFATLSVSAHPLLSGNEKYNPGCHHWKANVAIPYGAIDGGDRFLVSVGLNDCESAVVEIPKTQLPT